MASRQSAQRHERLASLALLLSSASSASGLILVLFVIGLRRLGAAQTGAYFSLAPFIGALIAIVFLGEPLTAKLLVAGALMGFGLWFHLAERHQHEHLREELEHEHKHIANALFEHEAERCA